MNSFKMRLIPALACFALASIPAGATGLGELKVNSGLGEPFSAEIELFAAAQEIASMSARIATPENYIAQGVERAAVLDDVKVELARHADGTPILKLSSPHPIDDPFLQMLVQIDWSNGRLLREYNALLDPPGFGERASTKIALPVTSYSQPGMTSNGEKKRAIDASAADGWGKPAADSEDGYVTKRGDTLRLIAMRMKNPDVSIEQIVVGLYQANAGAFTGGNMNRLKVGQLLHMPAIDELQAIGQKSAVREVRLQTSAWQAYRNKLAKASRSNGEAISATVKPLATVAEDKTVKASKTRFMLKVSPGDTTYSIEPPNGKGSRSGKPAGSS